MSPVPRAIAALILTAPQDGILVVGENPRERRKIQVGDGLWPGVVVARIPDLTAIQVDGDCRAAGERGGPS
jgi:hypothetical protein